MGFSHHEFNLGGEIFDLDTYLFRNSGKHLAVNVKNSGLIKIPRLYEKKMIILEKWSPRISNAILESAWQDTVEDWWDQAQKEATRLRLGRLHSTGRSGGWLLFDDYSLGALINLAEDYNSECVNCERSYTDHAQGHCLFSSTSFKSRHPMNLETFITLRSFCTALSESAKSADKDYLERVKIKIDDQWQAYQENKRRSRLEHQAAGIAGIRQTEGC